MTELKESAGHRAQGRLRVLTAMAMLSALVAVPAIVTPACGGTSVTDRENPTTATILVSADGGRIDGPLGAYIVVPPGALTADTPMAITLADDSTFQARPDAATSLGAVFAFTPHGQVFLVPAEIGLPSSATSADAPLVIRAADNASPWTLGPNGTFDDAGLAVFTTSQLSLYTVVGAGEGGIDAIFPGGAACSPDQRDRKWAAMLAAPITLPGRAGTLDLAGADKSGITRAEADGTLCGGVSRGAVYGDDTETLGWGPSGEFAIAFDKATQKARFAVLTGGYTGGLDVGASSDPDAGATGYTIKVGAPLTKAGAPVVIPWTDPVALGTLMNDLERAMLATFFPNDPAPSTACDVAPVRCSQGALGSQGYLAFSKLGLTIWVGDTASPDRASTPSRLDVFAKPAP